MKILAVMQNMWLRDPATTEARIAHYRQTDGDAAAMKYRRRIIAYALFAGCKSGKVLRKVFGNLCDTIVWEEASPKIGGFASSVFPPDVDHLRSIVAEVQPEIIIVFGEVARKGIGLVETKVPVIFAPHPAARHATVLDELRAAHKLLTLSVTNK